MRITYHGSVCWGQQSPMSADGGTVASVLVMWPCLQVLRSPACQPAKSLCPFVPRSRRIAGEHRTLSGAIDQWPKAACGEGSTAPMAEAPLGGCFTRGRTTAAPCRAVLSAASNRRAYIYVSLCTSLGGLARAMSSPPWLLNSVRGD
jgi:hypothetical protein